MPTLGVLPFFFFLVSNIFHSSTVAWPYYSSLSVFLSAFVLANRLCDRPAHLKNIWEHYTKSYTKTSIATSLRCLVVP